MAIPNPIVVNEMVNQMELDPEAEIDLEGAPAGMEQAIMAEIQRREENKRRQSIIDAETVAHPATFDDQVTMRGEDMRKKGASEREISEVQKDMLYKERNKDNIIAPSHPFGAAARGVGRGITLDLADELGGAGNAIVESIKNPGLSNQGTIDAYKAGRDEIREQNKEAMEAQPVASIVGMVGGGILNPVKNPLAAGGVAGAGANENLSELPQDVEQGMKLGGLMSTGMSWAGAGLKAGAEKAMSAADNLIASSLELSSDELIALKADKQLYQRFLDVVKSKMPFGLNPQGARESIELPAIEAGLEGTSVNPGRTAAQKMWRADRAGSGVPVNVEGPPPMHPKSWAKPSGKSRQIDLDEGLRPEDATLDEFHGVEPLYNRASSADLNNMMPAHPGADKALRPVGKAPNSPASTGYGAPEAPPIGPATALSEAEQLASRQLGKVADLRRGGMEPSSLKGGIARMVMDRGGLAVGSGVHQVARRMRDALNNADAAAGMSRASSGALLRLIEAVENSPNPDLEDYLAKEMSPEYNALSLEAKNALEKETN